MYNINSDFYKFNLFKDYKRERLRITYNINSDLYKFNLFKDNKRAI
jgi:hypothetical protein